MSAEHPNGKLRPSGRGAVTQLSQSEARMARVTTTELVRPLPVHEIDPTDLEELGPPTGFITFEDESGKTRMAYWDRTASSREMRHDEAQAW